MQINRIHLKTRQSRTASSHQEYRRDTRDIAMNDVRVFDNTEEAEETGLHGIIRETVNRYSWDS